jgi:23S rRNA pseudoU1915 N3-methylase RlmH
LNEVLKAVYNFFIHYVLSIYTKTKELGWKETQGIQNIGIEDSKRNRIVEQSQVLKIWEKYITEIYDRANRPETLEVEPGVEVDRDEKGPYILQNEVEKTIKRMRNKKATGDDDVPGVVTVLWNQAVHTDREVTPNRPDIIMKNEKEKIFTLIDVAIPADRNVVLKEEERKLKYKSLGIEIQRMRNLKRTIIPVIIGATGIVTRSLKKILEDIIGKRSIDSLQKTAILGT